MISRNGPRKGRGALSNPEGRFESKRVETVDDGWQTAEEDEELPPLETTVLAEHAKSIISHNDSPDIGFELSINPYRGCAHGCTYCLHGSTPVLMADGTYRQIATLRPGDEIYGTKRRGQYRRYVRTRVLAHWETFKPAFRIELADGTELIASGDHRFLTLRGWKHVTGAGRGPLCRPHLTLNDSLLGTGSPPSTDFLWPRSGLEGIRQYETGYLCGMIRGDGHVGSYNYERTGGGGRINTFRLALIDPEAIARSATYLDRSGVEVRPFTFKNPSGLVKTMRAIRASSRRSVEAIRRLIEWPGTCSREWSTGFLAGIFDAEGSYSDGCVRITNTDSAIIEATRAALRDFGFQSVVEHRPRKDTKDIMAVRMLGGLREHLRFFRTVDPAINRKRDIAGQALRSQANLRVVAIEPLAKTVPLFDITTGTEDFIANGVVSHNCYARPMHAYVNLSPGLDFETKLFYKAGAAQLLDQELRKKSYVCKPINIGASTDPYQPIERKLKVTRSVLEVLRDFRNPCTIVTKSALVERDIDILSEMARDNLINVFVSVTTLDSDLKRKLEPRAPSGSVRLRAVRALRDAGIPVGVLVAPIIPAVNDCELERIVELAAQAGAGTASYVVLRLPYEVKDLFREWLNEHLPLRAAHVMSLIGAMRGGRDNDARFGKRMRGEGPFADLIRTRFTAACHRHGLARIREITLSTAHFRIPPPETGQLSLL